ncbi:Exocyst complex component EXO70H1 [Linum perenne]
MTLTRKGMIAHIFQSSKKTNVSPLNSFSAFPSALPPSPLHYHTFSASMMEEDIANAQSVISKWDLISSSSVTKLTSLFHSNRNEAREFLKSVKDIRRAMHFLVSGKHSDPAGKLALCQKLMQIAMTRLEKEFYLILSGIRDQLDPDSVSVSVSVHSSAEGSLRSNAEPDEDEITEESVPPDGVSSMSDLKSIADCMISSGYTKECLKIYLLIRKSIVDEGLYMLGVEHYRSSPLQRLNSEALENVIKNWMNAVNLAVKRLFLGEKFLCDHVFSANDRTRELCFSELVKEGAVNLFRFPELVAKNKHSKDRRIFPLMDLYEAMSNLWPEIESMFSCESTLAVKQQAHSSLIKLGELIRQTLSEFESTIQRDSSKNAVPNGGIHPLTRSVMDYLSSLADYSGILSDIVADSLPESSSKLPESYYESPTSMNGPSQEAVSVRLAWLILILLCKLDRKAEGHYKDVSLSYLFLTNNLQFIIEKVCTTRLRVVLGEDWVYKHVNKAKQYAASYETMTWNKVFSSIPTSRPFPELSPEDVEQCFLRFNAAFEESHRKQVSWIVPNRRFRDELKVSIARKLVPAYRDFYDTYVGMVVGLERVVVKFGPDDLENYLSDLYHGTASESGGSSSSSSSGSCLKEA